jgi:diaminopropionate ammonia-lyase
MLGYTRLMDEVAKAFPSGTGPDVIFVPGGVGGLLAAVAAWSGWRWQPAPRVIAVEPASAACLQASARAGQPTVVPGPFDTMMGPLRCGEVSVLALEAARPAVAGYIAIEDRWAETAMRRLARPHDGDPAIVAGPSGAAALGGLLATLRDQEAGAFCQAIGVNHASSVLIIVSEGMTDPALWDRIVRDA